MVHAGRRGRDIPSRKREDSNFQDLRAEAATEKKYNVISVIVPQELCLPRNRSR